MLICKIMNTIKEMIIMVALLPFMISITVIIKIVVILRTLA